jgi:DNA-binding NtrC family response regulator
VSPATQTKLLRVLDTGTFRHVGGTAEIHVDVRVLAATNRDIPAMVRQGLFREDLFYRLNTIRIEIPPLRERAGDIELLARHFVAMLNERYESARRISPETLCALAAYHWPGNVRELLHAMEAAMVVSDGDEILPEHLPTSIRPSKPVVVTAGGVPTLEELERKHIALALEASAGHRGRAAELLGISERNLYRQLRDYGLIS